MRKRYDHIILSAVVALLAFTSVIYISCTKDKCANYTCNNNGVCADGKCICTSQFVGVHCDDPARSYIILKNNAKASLSISVGINDSVKTVDPEATVMFAVASGQSLEIFSFTEGFYFNGVLVGRQIAWGIAANAPVSGSVTLNIDVPTDFYFMQVVNASSYNISALQVLNTNYNVTIPNDSKTYGMGYYESVADTSVQMRGPSKNWVFSNVSLPDTVNQVITLTAN